MRTLSLLSMSCLGAGMVSAVLILRTLFLYKMPKNSFLGLWYLVVLRLLCPFSIPFGRVGNVGAYLAAEAPEVVLPHAPVPTIEAAGGGEVTVTVTTAIPWSELWLVGVCLLAVVFFVPYLHSRREFQASLPVENTFTRQWLQAHRLRRTVSIRQSDRITAPLSYGILRPVILLPKSIDWEDSATLNDVFAHELVHIRRFDILGKLALAAVLCLHWFNPMVWVMYLLANRDMELSCDEAVIRQAGADHRADYARTLLRMEETKSGLRPLTNHFCKTSMEERIVAIMKTKKISVLSLTLAGLLTAGIAVCGFTVATQDDAGETYLTTDSGAGMEAVYEGDSTAWALDRLEQWEENLKPYSPFGITCEYDPETDDVRLYYEEVEVRSLYDVQRQVYLTEHAGYTTYSADAIDLYAVYENGKLTGLRKATKEEMDQQDRVRRETTYSLYAPFGLRYDGETDILTFEGKRVRHFTDSVEVAAGGIVGTRCEHFDEKGVVDVYTVWEPRDNGDGSVDPFGTLKGLRARTQAEFERQDVSILDGSASEYTVAYAVGDSIEEGVPFAEEFEPYRVFGLTFEEVGESGVGNVYLYGKRVKTFTDKKPDGGVFSFQSKDGGDFDAQTRYDKDGHLTGIEKVR